MYLFNRNTRSKWTALTSACMAVVLSLSLWAPQVQAHRQMQMMVKLGIYGPEVKMLEDNAADYLSRKPLIRQEHAAIMYALITQPTDRIVAELMAAQQPEQAGSEKITKEAATPESKAENAPNQATESAPPATSVQ